jgi:drug/metabolite transporter (DMT)-like permease
MKGLFDRFSMRGQLQGAAAVGEDETATHRRAVLFLVICVVLWSTSGVLIKQSTLPALALVGGRSAVAALVLWLYLRRPVWNWSAAQIGGAVSYCLMVVFFVQATQLTSAANAILLQYTAPIWVALFSYWFLGERPGRLDYAASGAILAGMALFFGEALTPAGMLGNLLSVLGGVALAWMTLFMRAQKDRSSLETVLLGNLLAAGVGVPFLLTAEGVPSDWAILGFLGVFQLGIPFLFYTVAIRSLSAIETILISCLEPILNPLLVFWVVGELPGPLAGVGGIVVLGAVLLRGLFSVQRPARLRLL